MKKCIVIGGGFAGLTSAAYLSKSGIKVELLEASPKLGGRAYSFTDNDTGDIIDNGQHIMMGCYKDTLKFFKIIKGEENLIYQKRMKVNFLKENFNLVPLVTSSKLYPFNLILAVLNYKAISISNRLSLLKFFIKLPFISSKKVKNLTVYEWLKEEKQNEQIRRAFWEILAAGALNTNINKASAEIFNIILKKIFLNGNSSAAIILPKYGLSETYCEETKMFLEKYGAKINFQERALEFKYNDERLFEIVTNKRVISDFDFVVSSIPLFALRNIKSVIDFAPGLEFDYSAILSVHLWLKENNFKDLFYGLINSKLHWIFNHDNHITLVISDANEYIEMTKEEILDIIIIELVRFTGLKKEDIISYKVIKEKRSTFIPSNKILDKRPDTKTSIKNFFLAGDWVNTGLPSTIESAVKSGFTAADLIINELENN